MRKGCHYNDGLGELKPALALGDVIGDRAIFTAFDPDERANNDGSVNQSWDDRFDNGWRKEDARGHGGVLNHRSFVLAPSS